MTQYTKAGSIARDRHALRVTLDAWNGPGDLVIGAAAISELLTGKRVEINFVQQRPGREPFVGHAGEGWISQSGRAVCLRIEGVNYTSPIAQVRQVVAGTRTAALVSRPTPGPVIDADQVQREAIDHDLVRSFV